MKFNIIMFNFKNSNGLLFIIGSNIILLFLYHNVVFTDHFYITTLSKRHDYDKILSLISFNRKIEWATYVLFPLVYILKNLCDRIYVMEEGTISKSGNHQVLLTTANLYSNYWKDLMADTNSKAPQLRGFIKSI